MKRTDLEKQLGHKINNKIQKGNAADAFKKTDAVIDKREQRRLDQAQGLIPFAVKINEGIVARVHEISKERQISVNELVAELLKKGMNME